MINIRQCLGEEVLGSDAKDTDNVTTASTSLASSCEQPVAPAQATSPKPRNWRCRETLILLDAVAKYHQPQGGDKILDPCLVPLEDWTKIASGVRCCFYRTAVECKEKMLRLQHDVVRTNKKTHMCLSKKKAF